MLLRVVTGGLSGPSHRRSPELTYHPFKGCVRRGWGGRGAVLLAPPRPFDFATLAPLTKMAMDAPSSTSTLVIDQTTVISLLAALALLITAYVTSLRLLPSTTTTKLRILFIWHLFDALIHFLFEGSFLYNCFFTYRTIDYTMDDAYPASLSPCVYFLGSQDRLYGSAYGSSPTAKLWQEYAKADFRWDGADVTIISLELLTVFVAGPLAAYVCELVRRNDKSGKLWFWASVLATGELYGGNDLKIQHNESRLIPCSRLHDFRA